MSNLKAGVLAITRYSRVASNDGRLVEVLCFVGGIGASWIAPDGEGFFVEIEGNCWAVRSLGTPFALSNRLLGPLHRRSQFSIYPARKLIPIHGEPETETVTDEIELARTAPAEVL